MTQKPLIIAGKEVFTEESRVVLNKYTGEVYATISSAGEKEVKEAVSAAKKAFRENPLDIMTRYNILMKAANLLLERREEIAAIMTAEGGKTITDARNEITWSQDLLLESAEETKRLHGECFGFWGDGWMDSRTC